MENKSTSIVNSSTTGQVPKTPVGKAASMATPVKPKMQSTRPASAVKVTPAKHDYNRPATAKKADRAPFSPVSLSGSVLTTASESREAARFAKMKSEQDRIKEVAERKAKWAVEKERKAVVYNERIAKERKRLQDEVQQAAELRKKSIEKQRELTQKEKETEKEQLAASLKARAQLADDLEVQAKAKRRISVFLNNQLRKKAMATQLATDEQRKKTEKDLLDSKRVDFLLMREAKKAEEERRRESLAQHTQEAQEQKKRTEAMQEAKLREEKALLETRQLNWQDDQVFKASQEQARRESLAYRLDKWRTERAVEHASKEQEALAAELDRELQAQARADTLAYEQRLKEERRQSLSYRLERTKKERDAEEGEKEVVLLLKEEEKKLQDEDREAIQEYKERIVEARRLSMQYRSQIHKQHKMIEESEKHAEQVAQHKEYELRAEVWKDVQAYREKMREEARRSLAFRLAEKHRLKEIDMTEHDQKMRSIHLDLLCRREDCMAMREHKVEEESRRRKSISMRLQHWKEGKMKEAKLKEKEEMMKEEDARLREMDREDLLAAKLTYDMMEKRSALDSSLIL